MRISAGRAVGAACLVAAAGLAGWSLWQRLDAEPTRWHVASDCGGPITQVACLASSARRATLRNYDSINHVVNALPARAAVLILTNDRQAFHVLRNPWPQRVRMLDLPGKDHFTIWPQDPFLVLTDREGTIQLLASAEYPRADDAEIAPRLAAHLGVAVRTSRLCFEGGNIVANGRHAFVGADAIALNAARLGLDEEAAVRRFQRELGRKVIVVGPQPQPVAHVDMILCPLDDARVMLLDTAWGARLAEECLTARPNQVERFERSCQELFFGHPMLRRLKVAGGVEVRPPEVVGQTARAIADSRDLAAFLDELAEALVAQGYQVLRVPGLLRKSPALGPSAAASSAPATAPATSAPAGEADYPCLTYANVLLERTDGAAAVYLPQYGWDALDSAAVDAWRAAGCKVVPVGGMTISSMYGGSLRCCVKVLRRETATAVQGKAP